MQFSRSSFIMWTDITISIISKTNPLEDIYNCFGIFYSLEREFSRFQEDSDLSMLNKKRKFEVSNRFIDILNLSKQIYIDSDGYFNPLVNLKNIWYSSDFWKWIFEKKEEPGNFDLDKISIIWNFITLKENQNLDFWWIVKWYTVDLVSSYLKEKWYKDFIVNAWWDIYLSWNNSLEKTPVVGIDNPFNTKELFATLEIKDKSISTSWTYKRKWNIDKEKFHHILNPKTGTNNNEIISITLIADKCYIADTYATACIAMGIKHTLSFLEKQNIDGVIIWSDSRIYKTKWMNNYNLEII